MISSSFRRTTFILLLAGTLTTWAPLDLLSRFWSTLSALWGENGCTLDPNGRCVTNPGDNTSSGTTTGDSGCTIDPDGRCLSGN